MFGVNAPSPSPGVTVSGPPPLIWPCGRGGPSHAHLERVEAGSAPEKSDTRQAPLADGMFGFGTVTSSVWRVTPVGQGQGAGRQTTARR